MWLLRYDFGLRTVSCFEAFSVFTPLRLSVESKRVKGTAHGGSKLCAVVCSPVGSGNCTVFAYPRFQSWFVPKSVRPVGLVASHIRPSLLYLSRPNE